MNVNFERFSSAFDKAVPAMAEQGWKALNYAFQKGDESIVLAWTPCSRGRCLVYRMKNLERTTPVRDIPLSWLAEGRLWAIV